MRSIFFIWELICPSPSVLPTEHNPPPSNPTATLFTPRRNTDAELRPAPLLGAPSPRSPEIEGGADGGSLDPGRRAWVSLTGGHGADRIHETTTHSFRRGWRHPVPNRARAETMRAPFPMQDDEAIPRAWQRPPPIRVLKSAPSTALQTFLACL